MNISVPDKAKDRRGFVALCQTKIYDISCAVKVSQLWHSPITQRSREGVKPICNFSFKVPPALVRNLYHVSRTTQTTPGVSVYLTARDREFQAIVYIRDRSNYKRTA